MCSRDDKSNRKSSLLNNSKSDFHEVTNNYHHNLANSFNQKVLPNQLLIKLAKDSIEQKNNRNITAQHEPDVNDKSSTNNSNKNHQNFEKNFKEIIKLKNIFKAKRFVITNSAENLNNFRNIKLQIEKSQDGVDEADECLTRYKLIETNGSENATQDESSNVSENTPINMNANGCSKSHRDRRKSFLKAVPVRESPNDVSAIKIKYVSQQIRGLTDGRANSNSHATIENSFRNNAGVHENSLVITNTVYSIPNIMINGNVTDLSDQTASGALGQCQTSVGK